MPVPVSMISTRSEVRAGHDAIRDPRRARGSPRARREASPLHRVEGVGDEVDEGWYSSSSSASTGRTVAAYPGSPELLRLDPVAVEPTARSSRIGTRPTRRETAGLRQLVRTTILLMRSSSCGTML
jgi:hypothetical protein